MEKQDLKKTAESLASCEAALRQAWSRARQPDAGLSVRKELDMLRQSRLSLLAEANRIRASIDKLAGKRYWWDVPFDENRPPLGETVMPEGVYSEQFELHESYVSGKYSLAGEKAVFSGGDLLNFYHSFWIPLYFNKAEMRLHLYDPMERRSVYLAEGHVFRGSGSTPSRMVEVLDDEAMGELYAKTMDEMSKIDSDLRERIERHNDFWDFMERWDHGSFYTNRQRWLMGQMETMDYFSEDAARSLRQRELEHKAWEEQANLEYKLRQARNRRNQAQIQQLQMAPSYMEQNLIRLTKTADVIYREGSLMAIFIPQNDQPVWEINASDELDPVHLEGRIYGIRELGRKRPEYLSLFCHLIQTYAFAMKPYSVLAAQPKGLTDEEWRAWAELRWSYTMWSRKR